MEKVEKINKLIYHVSNPIFRNKILKEGLIPKGKSETWLSDTKINVKVIFATNDNNPLKWFDSQYNDDIYEINTENLNNIWFYDPNFNKKSNHMYTYDKISSENLKLIWKGTGLPWDEENIEIINKFQKKFLE